MRSDSSADQQTMVPHHFTMRCKSSVMSVIALVWTQLECTFGAAHTHNCQFLLLLQCAVGWVIPCSPPLCLHELWEAQIQSCTSHPYPCQSQLTYWLSFECGRKPLHPALRKNFLHVVWIMVSEEVYNLFCVFLERFEGSVWPFCIALFCPMGSAFAGNIGQTHSFAFECVKM